VSVDRGPEFLWLEFERKEVDPGNFDDIAMKKVIWPLPPRFFIRRQLNPVLGSTNISSCTTQHLYHQTTSLQSQNLFLKLDNMQLSAFLLVLLPALVASYECVTSGTTDEVAASENCCHWWGGKFCGTTGNQGICVIPDQNLGAYKYCTDVWGNPTANSDCIPGDGAELTSCTEIYPTLTTSAAQVTITS